MEEREIAFGLRVNVESRKQATARPRCCCTRATFGKAIGQPSGVRDDSKSSEMGTRTEGNYRQGRLRAVCRDTSLKCDRLITPRDCESESSELGGSRRRVNAGGRAVRQDEFVKTRRARQGHKDADGPGQCPTMRLD